MPNIIDGIFSEMNRCRELIRHYVDIGPAGEFGRIMIEADIRDGEAAIASGDAVRCIVAYKALKECE
jgi:hypothetical protein